MRLVLTALALTLAGCGGSATMTEEAAPLAPSALASLDGLSDYLVASGVAVASARELPPSPEPGVQSAGSIRFDGGGKCTVYRYASAADAERYAPASTRQRNAAYSGGGTASYGASARRYVEVPTLFFGPKAALCERAPSEATSALKALAAYANASA